LSNFFPIPFHNEIIFHLLLLFKNLKEPSKNKISLSLSKLNFSKIQQIIEKVKGARKRKEKKGGRKAKLFAPPFFFLNHQVFIISFLF